MLCLKTFGGLAVSRDGAAPTGAAQQRKTLALLALLAAHGSRGISRDKIIAFLWPESDTEHGRGRLKQVCYALRRDLCCPELFLGATELRLNPAAITSDVQEFDAAVQAGELTHAAELYAGPFLDGFFVSDSVEFERWVEEERVRLKQRAAAVFETLARAATARGEHQDAVEWLRRLYSLEPLNSRVALDVMSALAAAGDRGAALEFGDAHQHRLQLELDAAPEPAVLELAERLRTTSPYAPSMLPTPAWIPSRPPRWAHRLIVALVLALVASLRPGVSRSHEPLTFSARVLGPDGRTSICQYLPVGAVVTARLLNVTPQYRQGGYGAFACPEDQLWLSAPEPGNWHVRIDLPRSSAIGALPTTHIETGIAFNRRQDIVIREASELGGLATFRGKPARGVRLVVGWDTLRGLMATTGGSDPSGHWKDFVGRSSIRLQEGVRYSLNAPCQYLGARIVNGLPAHFLFPTQVSSVNCELDSAPAVRFSHQRTRLVVTPLPGDIGGLSSELVHNWGYGWGVQYPVDSSQTPGHAPSISQLYVGGFMIGLEPDRVLSGVDLRGEAACRGSCRDLGMNGTVHLSAPPGRAGKRVVWSYSDSGSTEAVGIHIEQESFDGVSPADYVVFHFTLSNVSARTITFHAGFLGDWDIGENGDDDVGSTAMQGHLMYQTNDGEDGPFLGTLLVSAAPRVTNYFYRKTHLLTLTEQVQALTGRFSRPASDMTGDVRYIHGTGPFTLGPAQSSELWIAIVAGETKQQLLNSAAAAKSDIIARGRTDLFATKW